MIPSIKSVEARPDLRLAVAFEDGTTGIVDLSRYRDKGPFTLWNRPGEFERVRIAADGAIHWGEEIDLCPDAIYLELAGRTAEDLLPSLRDLAMHA